ncbi:MAG: PAS domain-containing protein, partial [Bacteroidetes Order II. Incertae sedis bacterium]|nr:PAS domain-containing protein [Bacteroidetes Order II. bacterium]
NWQDFARKAEIVIVDFQTNGIVSQAKLLAAEESLHQYQSLIDQLLEYEHTRSQVAGLQFSQIIDDSHLILLTSALVGLIALIMIATLMTKQVKTLLDTQERASEMQKNARVEQDRLAAELIQFIDTANAPIFGIDTKGQVNEWNQKAAVLTQFSKDEVMGRGLVAEFITEEYRDSVGQVLGQALQGTETANFEFPLYTKKGRRLEVLLNATSRRDIDNNIIGVIGVGQDITELKNARVAEDQLAKELTQFINTANAPIFGIDAQGRINEWNQTAAKITGYKKEDVLGENLVQEFITEDYRESVKAVLESALLGIETSNYEFPLYTNLGVRLDLLLNATTRRDTDGEIVGVIGVGQDISEVKRAQAALRQAQKMEVVGQLTGGLAHDFNNLLTVISGNLNFLVDELDVVSTDVAEIIDDAQSAAKDGAELTHRLLAFARQQVLEPQETLVNDLILDTSRLMGRTLGEDIRISTALASENPVVMVDQGQLESALMNLCINSRDAMQSGGSLAITSEITSIDQSQVGEFEDLAPGKYVVISVEDGGTGMSEKQIEQVFEPFYTTKEPGKGSGLGLSMVHGFVTQSRGTVVIESEQGTGSKIKLYLPEVTLSKTTLPPSIETTFSDRVANGREKILVVDDEPRVRKTAVRVLRKLGYEVIEAASGDEALASMEKNKDIDLLFSDIMMPGGMNGRELASIVTKKYPKVKIQLTSGYENVDVTRNSIDAALPLLKKPYDREQLSIALRKQLDGRP